MLVKEGEGGGGLADADEFVGALQDIFWLLVGWRRHAGQQSPRKADF